MRASYSCSRLFILWMLVQSVDALWRREEAAGGRIPDNPSTSSPDPALFDI